MGDFSNGINQENGMLGEMRDYNSVIKEHLKHRNDILDQHLQSAKAETEGVTDPEKLGTSATQLGSAGQNFSASKVVLRDVYGGSKAAFAKGLGRTGEETTLGLRPAFRAGAKTLSATGEGVVKAGRALGIGQSGELVKTAAPSVKWTGSEPTSDAPTFEGDTAMGEEGTPFLEHLTEPVDELHGAMAKFPVRPITATRASGGAVEDVGAGSKLLTKGAEGASALRAGAGVAADLIGKAGIGIGIVTGGESLMKDFAEGHVAGDDPGEKWGNRLSIAGGALDTLGLAVPPLAILGGIAGVASAIFSGEGHLKHAEEEAKTAKTSKASPGETPMQVTSMSSLGQIASQGTDIHASISGSSSF